MKNKRNGNHIMGGVGAAASMNNNNNNNAQLHNRDGSNEPYDNQRIDTGGGEYLQIDDDQN